jgi:hypothetical protein
MDEKEKIESVRQWLQRLEQSGEFQVFDPPPSSEPQRIGPINDIQRGQIIQLMAQMGIPPGTPDDSIDYKILYEQLVIAFSQLKEQALDMQMHLQMIEQTISWMSTLHIVMIEQWMKSFIPPEAREQAMEEYKKLIAKFNMQYDDYHNQQ